MPIDNPYINFNYNCNFKQTKYPKFDIDDFSDKFNSLVSDINILSTNWKKSLESKLEYYLSDYLKYKYDYELIFCIKITRKGQSLIECKINTKYRIPCTFEYYEHLEYLLSCRLISPYTIIGILTKNDMVITQDAHSKNRIILSTKYNIPNNHKIQPILLGCVNF